MSKSSGLALVALAGMVLAAAPPVQALSAGQTTLLVHPTFMVPPPPNVYSAFTFDPGGDEEASRLTAIAGEGYARVGWMISDFADSTGSAAGLFGSEVWQDGDVHKFGLDVTDFTKPGADPDLFGIRVGGDGEDVGLYLLYNSPSVKLGDVNGDGNVDNLDITPFVYALANGQAAFETEYPAGDYWAAECRTDGNVDNLDITPFVTVIVGGAEAAPEPLTVLAVLAGIGGLARYLRRRGQQRKGL